MIDRIKSFSQIVNQIGFAVTYDCFNEKDIKKLKMLIQDNYSCLINMLYDKTFLNWGFWDKKIGEEYQGLDFDIYSQLLLYYLIRPLVRTHFFNKRLLDIGCGNGISLKASSDLLKTKYSLGVDLVNKLANNAHRNFYEKEKIQFIQSDAECLPLANESFDVVINIESSHLYPRIEQFFGEVERVLSPGGFFCYADLYVKNKQQTQRLEAFIKTRNHLKIIQKVDITKMVQASIYQRLIVHQDVLIKNARSIFNHNEGKLMAELPALVYTKGLLFLPWWKIWLKTPITISIANHIKASKQWGKKYYFYYLIQKQNT
jgi:ubiquinone/menaquinone biosynthesis C-methylase UbiE